MDHKLFFLWTEKNVIPYPKHYCNVYTKYIFETND
jgi:hypothetical protein